MNQRFYRFSFYFGVFIFSLFFLRTTEKGFFLSKQSFENSFIIKRFYNSYQKVFRFYGFFFSLFLEEQERKGLTKGAFGPQ
jgi:hypothetical protein